jgi:hypothetical protein
MSPRSIYPYLREKPGDPCGQAILAGWLVRPLPKGRRKSANKKLQRKKMKTEPKIVSLEIEELEERIAPSVNGTGGYDGHPGNQSSSHGNPSGSATPEHKSGK